jgi:hypothetical protein
MEHDHMTRGTHPSLQPDAINLKFVKLYERLGFIEDSLSRVELQQDSLRPLLKSLEMKQIPVAQLSINGKKKENVAPGNMVLLEKLTSNA